MDYEADTVIDRLGGTSEVARICDCKPPSVHAWRKTGFPKPRRQFLVLAFPWAFEDLPPAAIAESTAESGVVA